MTVEKHASVINPNSGLASPICLMDSRLQEFCRRCQSCSLRLLDWLPNLWSANTY